MSVSAETIEVVESVEGHDFISMRDALKLTGWTRDRLTRVKDGGYIATFELPGGPAKYSRQDLQKVIREAVRPATASLAGK
jgi:hypothetical protein